MQELSNILRIVINDMQGTYIFITADHGFLYTYSPLSEGEKVAKSVFSGEVYEVRETIRYHRAGYLGRLSYSGAV